MTKKKTISKRRAKKALTQTALTPAVSAEAVAPAPALAAPEAPPADAPAPPAKRTRTRSATPRRSRAKAARGEPAAESRAVAATPAKVERTDHGVVIRMTPVAPSPFPSAETDRPAVRPLDAGASEKETVRPTPHTAEFDEPDDARAALERVESVVEELDASVSQSEVPGTLDWIDESRPRFAENGRADSAEDVATDAPGAPVFRQPPDAGPRGGAPPRPGLLTADEARHLSPSQKRRLRRKRRAQQRREAGPGEQRPAAPQPHRPAPRREVPPPPPRPAAPVARDTETDAGIDELPDARLAARLDEEPSLEERFERDTDLPDEAADDDDAPPTKAAAEPQERGAPAADRRERDDRGSRRRRGRRGRSGRRRDGTWEPRPDEATEDGELPAGRDVRLEATDVETEAVEAEAETAAAEQAPEPRREMIINIVPHEECRIAILADGKLEEIYLERASAENHVGNIYKGVVTNVEPSIQAAFVDFGLGKNGFLHISDLHPQYFREAAAQSENVGRKMPRRRRPPIQRCLRRGQTLLVQITKEGIGTKGPTLTTYLSIPGRFLVMMPGMRELGVSRKIEDEDQRRKLRAQLDELELPEDMGFIARTAAQDRTKRELQSDLNYLVRLWRAVERRIREEAAPAELYRETDLVIRTIRDVFASDVGRVLVDNQEVAERAREFLSIFSPRSRDTVVAYDGPEPIFHRFGIEAELERLHSRHVPLRSGGSLVIDQTEALVAIDVNSGRFRTEDDAEITAYKINLEAADEIPRQLRLRDLGGVIICDFIDMREERHRREIERKLIRNLKQHKERAKVLRMSSFGIIEMTRQRQRASLTRSVYQDCFHCRGTGLVKTVESVALDVMRLVQLAVTKEHIRLIEVRVSAEVADVLLNRKRAALNDVESRHRRAIAVRPDATYGLDQVQIQCFDQRNRLVPQA